MWTRNNDVSNWNMLKHFIYSSSSKSTTSLLCLLYYKYSSELSSFFCILSFLVIAISIYQTFYSATHYLAAVWLDSRHDLNTEAQMNKHRRDVIYEVDDQVWLVFENIKTTRSCKDLEDKQLEFYSITVKVEIFYRLQLSTSMRHIHSVFSLKIMQFYLNDSLLSQHAKSSRSLVIENEKHWKIEDILNFRRYRDWLQYRIKWNELDRDNEWYYADKEKFDDSKEVLNEFHKLYSNKSH